MLYYTMELTDEQIQKMLERYKKTLHVKKEKYHTIDKYDDEYMSKNRERSKRYYEMNKDKHRQYYETNKERSRLMSRLYYYKKRDALDQFMIKYPEQYKQLQIMGKIDS